MSQSSSNRVPSVSWAPVHGAPVPSGAAGSSPAGGVRRTCSGSEQSGFGWGWGRVGRREPGWVAGFTLLELLVVIAILAMLATLILPVLGKAKSQGRAAFCLNNLRQWGLATHLYAADYDDYLPPDGTPNPGDTATNSGWYIQLPQQLGLPRYHDQLWRTNAASPVGLSVWICPANARRSNGRNLFHYCLNGYLDGTGQDDRPVRLSALSNPSVLAWLFDSKNLPAVGYWGYVHTNLHSGGAQLLFLDGHARRFPRADYWDEDTNKGRTDHPDIWWVP